MRAFVGFGDLGRQIDALLTHAYGAERSVFFDDVLVAEGRPGAEPFPAFLDERFSGYDYFVCLGYRHLEKKQSIVSGLLTAGRRLPAFVHQSCEISPTAAVGPGAILYPRVLLDKDVILGAGALINNAATISHNSDIGACTYVSPGVTVCGNVKIGAGCFIGAGSVISDAVSVGDNVTIGIGSVVTRDLPSGVSAIGSPARILDQPLTV